MQVSLLSMQHDGAFQSEFFFNLFHDMRCNIALFAYPMLVFVIMPHGGGSSQAVQVVILAAVYFFRA